MKKVLQYGPWAIIMFSFLVALYFYFNIDFGMEITDLETSQTKKMATSSYLIKLESIGKISLAIIGVLWSIILFKGAQVELSDNITFSYFFVTNLCFLLSFLFYFIGIDTLLNYIFYHGTIDFEAPIVVFFRWGQLFYFSTGLIFFCFTVLFGLKSPSFIKKWYLNQ